jgi:hypothetical protein
VKSLVRERRGKARGAPGMEVAFYSGQGSVGEAASSGIKALTILGVEVMRSGGGGGLNRGNQGGGVNTLTGHLEARR